MFAAFLRRTDGGWTLRDEGEALVLEDRDDDGQNIARLLLGGGVELLAERHDVDAVRAERGADGRRGIGGAGWDLEFDVSNNFFSHVIRYSEDASGVEEAC